MTAVIMVMGEFASMLNYPFNGPAVVQGLHMSSWNLVIITDIVSAGGWLGRPKDDR